MLGIELCGGRSSPTVGFSTACESGRRYEKSIHEHVPQPCEPGRESSRRSREGAGDAVVKLETAKNVKQMTRIWKDALFPLAPRARRARRK